MKGLNFLTYENTEQDLVHIKMKDPHALSYKRRFIHEEFITNVSYWFTNGLKKGQNI